VNRDFRHFQKYHGGGVFLVSRVEVLLAAVLLGFERRVFHLILEDALFNQIVDEVLLVGVGDDLLDVLVGVQFDQIDEHFARVGVSLDDLGPPLIQPKVILTQILGNFGPVGAAHALVLLLDLIEADRLVQHVTPQALVDLRHLDEGFPVLFEHLLALVQQPREVLLRVIYVLLAEIPVHITLHRVTLTMERAQELQGVF